MKVKRRGEFIDVGRRAIPERVSDSPAKLNQVAHVVHLDNITPVVLGKTLSQAIAPTSTDTFPLPLLFPPLLLLFGN